jgi:hypothetical protein
LEFVKAQPVSMIAEQPPIVAVSFAGGAAANRIGSMSEQARKTLAEAELLAGRLEIIDGQHGLSALRLLGEQRPEQSEQLRTIRQVRDDFFSFPSWLVLFFSHVLCCCMMLVRDDLFYFLIWLVLFLFSRAVA